MSQWPTWQAVLGSTTTPIFQEATPVTLSSSSSTTSGGRVPRASRGGLPWGPPWSDRPSSTRSCWVLTLSWSAGPTQPPGCDLRTAPGTEEYQRCQARHPEAGIPALGQNPSEVSGRRMLCPATPWRASRGEPGITRTPSCQRWTALPRAACAAWRHLVAVPETAPQDLAFLAGPSGQNTTGSLFPFCPAHPRGSCKNKNGITNQRKSLSLTSSFTTLFPLRQHSGLRDVSAALLEHYCLKALKACSFLCLRRFPQLSGPVPRLLTDSPSKHLLRKAFPGPRYKRIAPTIFLALSSP